jgi:hypothetical protein
MIQLNPIIIDIVQPPEHPLSGLAGVLIGALGLAGTLLLVAAVLGLVLAGLMFWLRSRNPLKRASAAKSQSLTRST